MRQPAIAALLAVLLCSNPAVTADHDNTLQDPGFENRTSASESGWRPFENSVFSDEHARTGSWSMYNGGLSRTVAYQPFFVGSVSGSYQEFPATPGSRWQLTGYGFAPEGLQGAPAFGIVQVSFFDADGNDLGTVETAGSDGAKAKVSNEVNAQSPANEWVFLDTGIATAPSGTVAVHAFTLYVDYSGSGLAQGVFFDDLNLAALADD